MPLIDMHIHLQSRSSCSYLSESELWGNLADSLHGVCITDHHVLKKLKGIDKISQSNEIAIFFGVEITAREGDILAYGISEVPPRGLPAQQILSNIHQQGGVAICAHPFAKRNSFDGEITQFAFDGIEINGRVGKRENQRARRLAIEMDIPTTGGSDAHNVHALNTMATWFSYKIRSIEDIVNAIKKKKCKARKVR